MATVPNCARLEAETASYADIMDEVINFLNMNASYWTLIDSVGGQAFIAENLNGERAGMEWSDPNFRSTFDPDGEATTAVGFGGAGSDASPTAEVDTVTGGSQAFDEGSINNIAHIIELPDALVLLVENSNGTRHHFGAYTGVFANPFNASDIAEGLDIYGVMVGNPDFYTFGRDHYWISSDNTDQGHSYVRVGHNNWTNPHFSDISFDESDGGMGGETAGRYFWAPMPFQVDSAGDQPLVGYPKYVRTSSNSDNRDNKSVTPSTDSDQAWLYFGSDSSSPHQVIIWNSAVIV